MFLHFYNVKPIFLLILIKLYHMPTMMLFSIYFSVSIYFSILVVKIYQTGLPSTVEKNPRPCREQKPTISWTDSIYHDLDEALLLSEYRGLL